MRSDLDTPIIIGADECGYGSLAGPLVVAAAACRLAEQGSIRCRDSKKYSGSSYRAKMLRDIRKSPLMCHTIIEVSADDLCRWGYTAALRYAYRLAVATVRYALRPRHPRAIIDGQNVFGVPLSRAYVKADKNWPIVSLASCLGKCHQLRYMATLHAKHPEYGFITNGGYGTQEHLARIRAYGVLPHIHRIPVIARMEGMGHIHTRPVNSAS